MEPRLEEIIKTFSKLEDCKEATGCVEQLKAYLCEKFPCDNEVLLSFADLYRQADFKANIDCMSKPGTAEFIADCIEYYCLES